METWAGSWAHPRWRRALVAAGMSMVLPVGGLVTPGVARAEPTAPQPLMAAQRQRPVPGHAAVPAKVAVAGASVPDWTAPPARWPQAATAQVSLPAVGAAAPRAEVGGLPVTVTATSDPAGAHTSTARSATATARRGVRVQVFDQATAVRAGVAGVILRLSPAIAAGADAPDVAGAEPVAPVSVSVDYSGFQYAYGGDWASRLRLVRLSDCALTSPQRSGCAAVTPVASRNSAATHSVSADVPATGVYAVAAATSGGTGDYAASSLAPSSQWTVGTQTGDFTWSYPLDTPPVPTGDEPGLALSYASQSVDGRTASTNNQSSWTGEGFDLDSGYVERNYKQCTDAGGPTNNGDQCWGGDNATMSLAGHSGELVRDDASGAWHLQNDDGSKVEELSGASNGDNAGRYWRLTTTDGTQYVFGLNHPPGWASGKDVTNSTWTMPVYSTDKNDPCYNASFASSYCTRAWRWNLDYVVDPHGNVSTYWYKAETNYYKRGYSASSGAAGTSTQYIRGGYLTRIDYGQTSSTVYSASAPAQVAFGVSERCETTSSFNCDTASNFTKANALHWPDVPVDQSCDAGDACTLNTSPSFWSRKRLTMVTTRVLSGSSYVDVDHWTLKQSFPAPGDGTTPTLWLNSITRTDKAGNALTPPVVFGKTQLQNRVDTIGDGLAKLDKYRVGTIDTESGGHISVTYSDPDCSPTSKPDPESNARQCYPVYWAGSPPQPKPFLDWFQKYVVKQVVRSDPTGGAPDQVTTYQYLDSPAWHYDDQDGLVKDKYRTWGQFRGFSKVQIMTGDRSGAQSQTEEIYLRGMNGDRSDPDDASKKKPVTVTDSQGTAVTDANPLRGFLRERIEYNGAGGAVVEDTINGAWTHLTATRVRSWGTTTANVVRTGTTHTRTALAAGGWRQTETDGAYNNEGLTAQIDNHGDLATAADDRCERTTYVRNETKGMINYPSRVESVAVSCSVTPNRPADVISDVRTSYDGQAWGTSPARGDVTRSEKVASYNGSSSVYVTNETRRYDGYGRVIESDDAMGRRTTTAYTPATGPVTKTVVTNNLNYSATTTLDPGRGQPSEIQDINKKVTDLVYDAVGRLTQVWLPGRSKSANPSTPNLRYGYHLDGANSPTYTSTGTLRPNLTYTTSYQLYDGFLRKRQTQSPAPGGGRTLTDAFYDTRGLIARANSNYYDSGNPDGTLFVPTAAVPGQTVTEYDGVGRPIKESLLRSGNHLWDTLTTYGGDRITVTPPEGGTATTTVTDVEGRTTQLMQYHSGPGSDADVTNYTYTPAGDVATVTDPTGHNTWRFAYNLLGQKTSQTQPDTGATTYTYDNDGEVTSSTDARGTTLAYSYDGLGRRTGEYLGSLTGSKLAAWVYDTVAKGQPTSSIRYVNGLPYSTTVVTYDERYQPTETDTVIPDDPTTPTAERKLAGTYVTYADANVATDNTPHRISYPAAGGLGGEVLLYAYDNLGQPVSMSGVTDYVSGTTYSALGDGNISAVTLGTGAASITRNYTYEDATNRLTRVLDQRGNPAQTVVNDTRYTSDDAGNITGISNTQQDGQADIQCFEYDYLRRLTQARTQPSDCGEGDQPSAALPAGPAPYWQSYTYDRTGNLTARTDHNPTGDTTATETYPDPGTAQPHTLTALTRHTAAGDATTSYTYDPAGNLTRRTAPAGDETFTWDAEGKLATDTKGDASTRYLYDTDGSQLIEVDPGGATLYLDNMEIHADNTGATSATRYYSFAGDTIAARTSTALTWILTDDQNTGQTEVSADANQTIVRRYQTPYGDTRGTSSPVWTGQRGFVGGTANPSTGLMTIGARQYDSTTGRFISHDPVIDTSDPQQLNGYAYGDDTPVTKSDPSGLIPGGPYGDGGGCWGWECTGGVPGGGSTGGSSHTGGGSSGGCHGWECNHHQPGGHYSSHRPNCWGIECGYHPARPVQPISTPHRGCVINAPHIHLNYCGANYSVPEPLPQSPDAGPEKKHHRSLWDRFVDTVNFAATGLTVIALATVEIPGVDVVTASLALAADTIAVLTNGADTVDQLSKKHYKRAVGATVNTALSAAGGGFGGRALRAEKRAGRAGKVAKATKKLWEEGETVAGKGISERNAKLTLASRDLKTDARFAAFDDQLASTLLLGADLLTNIIF